MWRTWGVRRAGQGPGGRSGDGAPDELSRRLVERRSPLPGGRAVVGGLLVAVAGVGTFAAWQQASGVPEHAYAVAVRALQPGDALEPDLVRLTPVDLPHPVAAGAFVDEAELSGRVALAPIGEGELLQRSQLSEPGAGLRVAEVSLTLERDRAVDGRLRSGDLIDLFVTSDDRTTAVVEGVRVISADDGGAGGFAGASPVTVTLALEEPDRRAEVIHAARAGEVTLVRSTHRLSAVTGALAPPAGDEAGGAGG